MARGVPPRAAAGRARRDADRRDPLGLRIAEPPTGWSTYVAEENERVVGFVSVGPSRERASIGELYAIYVEPDAWSTGAGRALIERGEARLAESYVEATLWVLEDNQRARGSTSAPAGSTTVCASSRPSSGKRSPRSGIANGFQTVTELKPAA